MVQTPAIVYERVTGPVHFTDIAFRNAASLKHLT